MIHEWQLWPLALPLMLIGDLIEKPFIGCGFIIFQWILMFYISMDTVVFVGANLSIQHFTSNIPTLSTENYKL